MTLTVGQLLCPAAAASAAVIRLLTARPGGFLDALSVASQRNNPLEATGHLTFLCFVY